MWPIVQNLRLRLIPGTGEEKYLVDKTRNKKKVPGAQTMVAVTVICGAHSSYTKELEQRKAAATVASNNSYYTKEQREAFG